MSELNQDVDLTSSEIKVIEGLSARVEASVRSAFEISFKAWKDKWFTGPALFSSDTNSNKLLPEYNILRTMGDSILPLIVRELANPENFPLLVLYDDIAPKDFLVDANAPEFALDGEQARAIRTIKKYLYLAATGL